jgi:hypothetical protein
MFQLFRKLTNMTFGIPNKSNLPEPLIEIIIVPDTIVTKLPTIIEEPNTIRVI